MKIEALGKLRGLSQDRGRAKFAENLRASSFQKDLSNETTFGQIHLDGQYLWPVLWISIGFNADLEPAF